MDHSTYAVLHKIFLQLVATGMTDIENMVYIVVILSTDR